MKMKLSFENRKERGFWSRAGNLIVIFLVLAILMITSAFIELNQSKSEQLALMREQAHSLLESIIVASTNSLLANEELELSYRNRLLNNAVLIKEMFEKGIINNSVLRQLSKKNNIYRVNIFNNKGQKIFYSHEQSHFNAKQNFSPKDVLRPIFTGEEDTLIFGLRQARYEDDEIRYAIAIAAKNRSAIVLNVNAAEILDFRKNIGFGVLLRKVSESPSIIYLALQDSNHILAAAGSVNQLKPINDSPFLSTILSDSIFDTRQINIDTVQVFEAAHPFVHHEKVVGLFRVGLSMEPIQAINSRVFRRIIVITIFLIVLGTIFLTIFFTRQKYDLLRQNYDIVETYSGNIIQNVSDAIIVAHEEEGITVFNSAAKKLFNKNEADISGKSLKFLLDSPVCDDLFSMPSSIRHFECDIDGEKKYLLISKNEIADKNLHNIILVIRDLTQEKLMEAQMHRNERLTAMGELASGVAHEIRNPLNTIGTIVQQLDKDFEPVSDKREYHELAGLVYNEVKRINETVQDFLRFSRPEPIQPSLFPVTDLINQVGLQYKSAAEVQNIKLNIDINWHGEVYWDNRQIKQVLINIIQNAIEAVEKSGKILLSVNPLDKKTLEIIIQDDGKGMTESERNNIFNLYFTTKARGTGIGLSIVQRIVYEHGGIISVNSEPGKGSAFVIKLPIRIDK
ncbi:MAG: GHKL domain-containing protein [Calditrichaeota bacterium]|nr:MAG: GHKL domain-containing protein [Calditrichota bacterium]MBL1205228.1 GHKL domain-containing protein [Calditrichota bacterium]NOG45057.1 GHKL domain-containing protein [Calditrichota bacterium]